MNPKLNGVPVTEAMWSNPAVVRAVVQLIIDAGVSAGDITMGDSLGSGDSFNNSVFQGYVDIKNWLISARVRLWMFRQAAATSIIRS